MEKFTFHLTPLNEGQELNYVDTMLCSIEQLRERCNYILAGLSALFPEGTFDIKIEHYENDAAAGCKTWYYRNDAVHEGKYYDKSRPNNFYDDQWILIIPEQKFLHNQNLLK